MVDYLGVCLTGVSTGFGVIISQEIWAWSKRHRERLKKHADDMIQDFGWRRRLNE